QSLVDGVPEGGDEALCAVERALLHRNGVHRFHRLPDALVYRGEVQNSGLIIVVLWVVEETLADLQYHWGPGPLEVDCFFWPVRIDGLDLPAQLRVASAGEHAAMILLVLFAQQLQQFSSESAVLLCGIQQSHGLAGEHLVLIQKRPKLLKVGNLGRQTAGVSIVGQVDKVLQGDRTPAMAPLHCQQSLHPYVFLRGQCGQPLGQ
ncbi:imidazole glycerol phosphate synthase subunit HisH, partial [Dysosmobacter welbionis]